MPVIYAVIDDVYNATVGGVIRIFLGGFHVETREDHLLGGHEEERGQPQTVVQIPPLEVESGIEPVVPQTFKPIGTVIDDRALTQDLSHTIAYVGSAKTPLFGSATKDFDTVVTSLSYGTMVMVLEEKGRFSRVAQDGMTGWVLREDLADRAAYVYPEFVVGEENTSQDPNTLRLRACIHDEFHGGETEVPLQAGEYVLYRLIRKGQTVNWPRVRPRTPGRWHTILRGVPGVYIGIVPKTGSVMECTLENDIGHLAYVEAVFPDERITISEVNNPDNGIYQERTLTKAEWQLLNPVFIQFS
jgi:hypothetical protein